MTDKEIIKALECCTNPKVGVECPRAKFVDVCTDRCIQVCMEQSLDLIKRQQADITRLQEHNDKLMSRIDDLTYECDCAKQEAIKEFQRKSESILIKLYEKYHRIANKPNSAWFKIFTREENEMYYQGRAEAIWECIDTNRSIIKEMTGEQNETKQELDF